jgi:NAD(P)-dependent dehydrogenase (short-subunit alcohol dehydrogenase family)
MAEGILVVTGGASGIGLACAKALAGAHEGVVLVDANAETLNAARDEVSALGVGVQGFECDVADAAAQIDLADTVEREVGPVRTLITCAGILNNSDTVMDMDLAEHDRVWDVNYNGTIYSVRAFARAMTTRRQGSVLTIGSINSFAAFPLPAYCPSKTAIMRLTQMLAVELGRFDIRVNGVAPTYVLSPAIKARIDSGDRDPDAIRKAGAIEMFVYPEDIANVAAFLCSDAASAVTGTMMPVDAGWEAATTYRAYAGGVPWED